MSPDDEAKLWKMIRELAEDLSTLEKSQERMARQLEEIAGRKVR